MNFDADPIALILEQQDSPFGSSLLFGFFGLLVAKVFDETGDDSARLVACLARIIHDGSSRSGARHERGPAGLSCLSGLSRLFG